jgi:hypothetical protein
VGYVLGRSDGTGQRVFLLYRSDRLNHISRLIAGNSHPRCTVLTYDNPTDLVEQVSRRLRDTLT